MLAYYLTEMYLVQSLEEWADGGWQLQTSSGWDNNNLASVDDEETGWSRDWTPDRMHLGRIPGLHNWHLNKGINMTCIYQIEDFENLGQLPVLFQILALSKCTDTLVACIPVISSVFLFSRSKNPVFAVPQNYHVRVTSKIRVKFRFWHEIPVLY